MQRLFVLLGVVIVFALIFGFMFAYYRSQGDVLHLWLDG